MEKIPSKQIILDADQFNKLEATCSLYAGLFGQRVIHQAFAELRGIPYIPDDCFSIGADYSDDRVIDLTVDVWGGAGPDCCIQPT